jgi:cytochrome b6-f complex iron-sulfur subunit
MGCQALSLASIAGVAVGCGGDSPSSPSSSQVPELTSLNGTVSGNTTSVAVDSGPLATVGNAAIVRSSAATYLVSRTGTSSFVAVTATCTHQGCTVVGFTNQHYVCPCHGSRFSMTGSVVNGPATTPLRQFATQLSGTTLAISG